MPPCSSIIVKDLVKRFSFPIKNPHANWLTNLFTPQYKNVAAVNGISFEVGQGERVAFIGPNGAGKSTTIKMLTGILQPSSGLVSVLGLSPSTQRKELAYKIGTVFGQRSQLLPNLPLTDSFEFFGVMYDMTDTEIQARSKELIELFDMGSFADQPVRKLSLGQRMRAEIATSLIHRPKAIFLDEPTIGLDVVAKRALRELLIRINREEGTTLFLTSHDVGDISSLCERTLVINHGKLLMDMPTRELSKTYVREKCVDIIAENTFESFPELPIGMLYAVTTPQKITVQVNTAVLALQQALRELLNRFQVVDINVYDQDLEAVIRKIYESTTARS